MLYLLFVLTFLCGILFYGLSPHDKGLDMTARQAEGMIATFLAQHQAARDYLYTWLGASNDATTGNLQTGVYENFLKADFEKMIPWGVISDMCRGNNVTPGQGGNDACFVSKVVDDAGKHYVITYGGWTGCTAAEMNDSNHYECYLSNNVKRPDWWPSQGTRMRRFESWRRAIANRTRGSISCGTLVEFPESSGNWCIDNGEKVYKNENATHPVCMNQVPLAVISALPYASGPAGLDDLLFCVSEFKQGQDNYQSVAEHFYDGFANAGVAQHTASGNSWADLGSSSSPSNLTMATNWQGKPYFDLHGYLRTGIRLGHSYTLTVLLSGYSDAKAVSCDILGIADDSDTDPGQVIFKKLPDTDQVEGVDGVHLLTTEGTVDAGICNRDASGYNKGIVSWTLVVNGATVNIYENAIRRFKDQTITNTEDKYLVLGNDSPDQVPFIYGIRYYDSLLSAEQIRRNFKVDQKRFGIVDINNGKTGDTCVN